MEEENKTIETIETKTADEIDETKETDAPTENAAEEEQQHKVSAEIKEWIRDIIIAVLIAVCILQFVKPTIVKESSMEPTLYANHYIFLSKQAYTLFGDPERGDIAVFQSDLTTADGSNKLLIKRIIGLPGDKIDIYGGQLYINDEPYYEEYIKDGITTGEVDGLVVPEGYLFCMGDNRIVSIDSRDERVGCVSQDLIVGKAVLRLTPIKVFGPEKKWISQSKLSSELAGDTAYIQ